MVIYSGNSLHPGAGVSNSGIFYRTWKVRVPAPETLTEQSILLARVSLCAKPSLDN
ncbi:MAG: hypothetical protein L3J11_11830 [Draconibacterium sp.]|nr:hypothetical protein [Draconibacterium sp.]